MTTGEQRSRTVSVEFVGTALGLSGKILLLMIGSALVIPAPWVVVWFHRWWIANTKLSDNTQLSFVGEGSQVWFPIMAIMVLSQVTRLTDSLPLILLLPLLLTPITTYFNLLIAKWFWRSVVPSSGTRLSFVGTYLPLLGWGVLSYVSLLTIVGWAWVSVGAINWMLQNIRGNNHVVEFHGDGWNILWRTVVFALSCVLLIPIPWTLLWLVRWFIANVSIRKATA